MASKSLNIEKIISITLFVDNNSLNNVALNITLLLKAFLAIRKIVLDIESLKNVTSYFDIALKHCRDIDIRKDRLDIRDVKESFD